MAAPQSLDLVIMTEGVVHVHDEAVRRGDPTEVSAVVFHDAIIVCFASGVKGGKPSQLAMVLRSHWHCRCAIRTVNLLTPSLLESGWGWRQFQTHLLKEKENGGDHWSVHTKKGTPKGPRCFKDLRSSFCLGGSLLSGHLKVECLEDVGVASGSYAAGKVGIGELANGGVDCFRINSDDLA